MLFNQSYSHQRTWIVGPLRLSRTVWAKQVKNGGHLISNWTHLYLSMVLEPPGGLASSKIPQSQGLVPWAGEGKVTIRWQDNVTDKVVVTGETLLGDTIVVGVVTGQLPYNQRLVPIINKEFYDLLGVWGKLEACTSILYLNFSSNCLT